MRKTLLLAIAFCVLLGTVYAQVTPDPNNPAKEKRNVVKILRTSNKAQINRYVPKVFELKHANPYHVAFFMREVVKTENGMIGTWAKEGGVGGMVMVVVPEYQLATLEELAKQMDRPKISSTAGSKCAFVELKHRAATYANLGSLLLQYGCSDTSAYVDGDTNAIFVHGAPSGTDAVLAAVGEYDLPNPQVSIEAAIYEIELTNDGALGLDFHAWKNGPGRALFSLGAFHEGEKIDYSHANYNGTRFSSAYTPGLQFSSGAPTLGFENMRMNTHGYNGAYYWDVPSAFFDFLAIKGKARALTKTHATALSGVTATFMSVEQALYYRVDVPTVAQANPGANNSAILPLAPGQALLATGTVNDRQVHAATTGRTASSDRGMSGLPETTVYDNSNAYNSSALLRYADYTDIGVILEVTPTVAEENIDLDVYSRNTVILGYASNGSPQLSTQEIDTEVRTQNGEEVVMAGMNRERNVVTTRKVPFLGSIPVLGYLFGGEIKARKVMTIVEAITPTCVEGCVALTPEQMATIEKAKGELTVKTGTDEYGFGQYLIDRPMYQK